MAISAKSIAKELGLAESTVSLALRGLQGISEDTRQKVLEKASEMGYHRAVVPTAEQLHFLSLVLYKKHGIVLADTPFFSDLIQGIDQEAKRRGYQVFITYFYENQDLTEQMESLKRSLCSGVILLATEMQDKDLTPFEALNVPLVVVDRYFPEFDYDCIVINNIYGAKQAVQHLIESGHTRIGYLHSSLEIRNFRERYEGFMKGILRLGNPEEIKPPVVRVSTFADEATADMDAYLASRPVLPSAFFADNDIIASSCMLSLKKAGYRIPEDVSIVGFDNMALCKLTEPALTTMAVDKEQLGAFAADFLIRRIEGWTGSVIKIEVKPHFVERNSIYNVAGQEKG
jgi:Transcriptional regulators